MRNLNPEYFNKISEGHFPGFLGIVITDIGDKMMEGEMPIQSHYFAPNKFIHAGSVVTLADTIAGYSVIANMPEGAKMFTTLELKSNFLGSAKAGTLLCKSSAEHLGRTTQVWRAEVYHKETDKKLAIFTCTQLIIY